MSRFSYCLAFGLVFQSVVLAGEPQPTTPPAKSRGAAWSPLRATAASATAPGEIRTAPSRELQGRKKLDALLQSTANLNYDGRDKVTVKEVLDDLHRQHQLSIRFDMPTLTSLFGGTQTPTVFSQNESVPVVGSEPPQTNYPVTSSEYPASNGNGTASITSAEVKALENAAATKPAPLPANPAIEKPATKTPDKVAPEAPEKKPAAAETKESAPVRVELAPGQFAEIGEAIEGNPLEDLLETEVNIERVDFKKVTIATVLRHALDALPAAEAMSEAGSGMPIKMTNAAIIDYVVEDDGLLITTRLNALTVKETRVYSLKNLKDVTPDQLAKVVRQSIRPWSWRSQINDLGDQLKSGLPQQLPADITSLMSTGLQLVAGASGIPVTYSSCPDGECQAVTLPANAIPNQVPGAAPTASPTIPSPTPPTISVPGVFSVAPAQPDVAPPHSVTATATVQPDAAATTMALSTLVNALEVVAHAALSGVEMMHYADPPTGTIQTLPGKLVITQSQAAHREIADLMKQLEDE